MSKILLSNMTVYAEERVFKNGYVLIENGKILDVGPQEKLAVTDERVEKIESKNNYAVIPGFIDLHIHGAAGADTMDGTDEAIRKMAAALPGKERRVFSNNDDKL